MDDAWHWLIYLIGGGGASTIAVAWLGWRSQNEKRSEERFKYAFADHAMFERLAGQIERLSNLIEKAIEKYDTHMMFLRREK